ncbi:Alpha/Beta hydrolase protein [Glomus cerebriforme]|uniref:Alpha/Beta hydrolase protein n=1 Tax=Glomus cerebriforme TaxID=658196 RepID=A0A397SVD1_9GLOM|nr:Alpha/Beta hydrolase protein [Glomus cerebriforme]
MLIAASVRAAQLKQVLIAVVSATSDALLQAKQRLSFAVNNNSSHESDNGSFEKRSGLEMPVKPNYLAPRLPIVLCHGLFGFDKLGPSSIPYLQIHYWGGIQEALQKIGAKVVITKVPRTGCIRTRAHALHNILENVCSGGIDVNLLAHSMGGLDCRYLIANLPTKQCTVRSLTTVATPHRGSPFMDWCRDNIGVGEIAKAVDDAIKRLEDQIARDNSHEISKNEQSYDNIIPPPPYREKNDNYQRTIKEQDAKNLNNKENQNKTNNHNSSSEKEGTNKKSFNIPIPINLPNISIPNLNFNISLQNLNINLSSIPQTTYSLLHPVTRSLIQALDTPAYSNLTTDYCVNHFNKNTPNHPSVAYFSYGAATDIPIWSPLYFPHQIIKAKEGPNDGLVSVKSAQWGRYVETVECDHWDLTDRWRIKIGSHFDPVEFYLSIATFLASEGY